MKVCIIFVATNKYITYLEPVIKSAREHFLSGHELSFLVFSNHAIDLGDDVHSVYIDHKPFPEPTLKRYHYISSQAEYLKQFDYCFYLDVDMRIVDTVGDEILGFMTATIHPGYYNVNNLNYTYERNRVSKAYIGKGEGVNYYAGGFVGGQSAPFLKMARTIKNNIDADLGRGYVAVWHDESHMNRYFFDNPPDVKLSPEYCYPEHLTMPFKKRILALYKNHEQMRC